MLRVLVVDGSAVRRQALLARLEREPHVEVEAASTPTIARQKMKRHRPDVLLLGVESPGMEGLTALRPLLQAHEAVPVVVCGDRLEPGTEGAVRALRAGAAVVLVRPPPGEAWDGLLEALRGAARTRAKEAPLPPPAPELEPAPPVHKHLPPRPLADTVVAVGASTGGTEALREFLVPMPPDCPGIVIVQHMPERFTGPFARRLDELCRIEVREARHGDPVMRGRALIAPGNQHLRVRRGGGHYVVEVLDGERVSGHRPSVDVLFRSVAKAVGAHAVGVLLTGMGEDGADGLLLMKQAGAVTLAQDEASCVVFGMPRAAIARGAVDEVLPLSALGEAVRRRARL